MVLSSKSYCLNYCPTKQLGLSPTSNPACLKLKQEDYRKFQVSLGSV